MNLLAVDFGMKAAWCYGSERGNLRLGFWPRLDTKSKVKASPQDRFRRFRRYLDELMDSTARDADTLAHEIIYAQAHRSQAAAKCYFSFLAVLEEFAYDNDLTVCPVAPTHIKRIAAGRGNASKGEVQAAIRSLYPDLLISNQDVADALALWHVVMLESPPCATKT